MGILQKNKHFAVPTQSACPHTYYYSSNLYVRRESSLGVKSIPKNNYVFGACEQIRCRGITIVDTRLTLSGGGKQTLLVSFLLSALKTMNRRRLLRACS